MNSNEASLEAKEILLEKHRQEKKELTAKVTKLRHSVPKNDKKRKKEINIEIENLELALKIKHETELKKYEECHLNSEAHTNDIDRLAANSESNNTETVEQFRVTKSQRRRENKERKEKERQERIKAGQIDDSQNIRLIEMKRVEGLLEGRGLNLCEISSDGDCMYKAIEHQMRLTRNAVFTVDELRHKASEYIRLHKDDFVPFLLNDENNVVSDQEFDIYCDKIINTKTWGGNLELKALSNSLKVPIEIIQAEGSSIKIGFSEFVSEIDNPLILCYFRHAYQLGEHYNSVMPNGDVADEEEWHGNSDD